MLLKNTKMGEEGLSVYHVPQSLTDTKRRIRWDQFVFLGYSDCFAVEPEQFKISTCTLAAGTELKRVKGSRFLGKFLFANGFDPPKGHFTARVRFLQAYEVTE